MKKIAILFSVSVSLSLLFVSCALEQETYDDGNVIWDTDAPEFYASVESADTEDATKVYLDDNLKVLWNADDRISIFNKITLNQQYRFKGADGDNAGSFGKIESGSNDEFVTYNEIDNVYAVYPYKESNSIGNNEVLYVTLPAVQTYANKSFGQGVNTMIAAASNNQLQFKNVCGYLMLKLYGSDVKVKSITLKGNNGEKIAGDATISMKVGGEPVTTMSSTSTEEITVICTDAVTLGTTADNYTEFWFAIPPVKFEKGFTITLADEDGVTFSKSMSDPLDITRSYVRKMSLLEVTLSMGPTKAQSRLRRLYDFLYIDSYNGVRPHPVIANQPSLDMQSEGWDAEMSTHSWGAEAKSGFFETLWESTYKMVDSVNVYLSALEKADPNTVSEEMRNTFEGEARGLRGYCYYILTSNFGPVPMRMTGETRERVPAKARPKSDDEAWEMILEDFEFTASVLDWTPYNGETGHFTKTAALAYAAKAHMYKGEFAEAAAEYKQIVDGSGKKLNPVHGMLHWLNNPDSEESIWEISYPEYPKMDWGASAFARDKNKLFFAPMQNKAREYGGWGDSPVSFEYSRSFEPGDKRLMYNVAGWHEEWDEAHGKMVGHGDINYYYEMSGPINANFQNMVDQGFIVPNRIENNRAYYYPTIGGAAQAPGRETKYREFFQSSESNIPNNHSMKWWKSGDVFSSHSIQLYRYTGVLLDYAECCFRTGDATTGWKVIADIRNRAWGNLEVGYNPNDHTNSNYSFPTFLLNTEVVEVPDAQKFYTEYKAKKGYKSDAWLVAVTQERRKEFMQEFCFWYDLTRLGSDFVQEWLDCEYPKNGGASFYNTQTGKYYVTNDGDYNQPYRDAPESEKRYMIPVTARDWDWNPIHKRYPIPTSELTANNLCTQNPGY